MISIGAFERRSLRLARLLAQLPMHASVSPQTNWVQLLKEQARITAVAPVEALNALGQMLPDAASRERALALAAAVMMIEPTLANPRSEIIELLVGTLDVEPDKVIALARKLTTAIGEDSDELRLPQAESAPAVAPRKAARKPVARKPVAPVKTTTTTKTATKATAKTKVSSKPAPKKATTPAKPRTRRS